MSSPPIPGQNVLSPHFFSKLVSTPKKFLESEVSPPKKFAHSPLGVFLAPSLSVQLKLLAYLCYTGNFEILCKWVTYDLKLEMCTVSP